MRQIIRNTFLLIITCSILFAVSSCSFNAIKAYPGETRIKRELALIKDGGFTQGVIILSIQTDWDPNKGYDINKRYFIKGEKGNGDVEVLPGKHNIALEYFDITKGIFYSKVGNIVIEVEAGQSYTPKGVERTVKDVENGEIVLFWMENDETGEVVGGYKP